MTSLAVEELKTTLTQDILIGVSNLNVEAIRPRLYKHNTATGSVTIEVRDTNGETIKASNTIAISALSAAAFFHGFIQFDINIGLKAETTYQIALVPSGGYSFGESAYVGWVLDHEDPQVGIGYSAPNNGFSSPRSLQLWTRDKLER